ncbi:glycosyltransferase [Nostoc piscinale]|uniref:glycosyltransferase n=1 Tax=Nostoc piscinale TaxID=224012 RepID=UPI0007813C88|nr:glycosyltransferase [Nostoc piscinale]
MNSVFQQLTNILPITTSEIRPFWSVMIPTYNCANYLKETLLSVLTQDPGLEQMQIEVIDDCSTKDDPETVVKDIGQGRVSFFRQQQNVGATANFNTCIQRAKGEWIHILHGDDTVLPNFYSRLRQGIEQDPTVGAAFSRYLHIDESSNWRLMSHLERETAGTLPNFWQTLAVINRVMTPCIVVKRSVYEDLGGFHPELIHAADWEMWRRIAVNYPIWFEPQPLACYREHSSSDTSRLTRSGANLIDICKSIDIAESYLPEQISVQLSNQSREYYAGQALNTAHRMLNKGDMYGAINQIQEALKCCKSPQIISSFATLLTNSEACLRLAAFLFTFSDANQLITALTNESQLEEDIEFEFRDINLIIFPNWENQHELLYEDLAIVIKFILTSPDREKISLFIENSQIADEDANFIISDVIFNLLQQENIEIIDEPVINVFGNISQKQWHAILTKMLGRIDLNNQNQEAIIKLEADRICSITVEKLSTHQLSFPNPAIKLILSQIENLPSDWHTGGALSGNVLQAIAKYVSFQDIFYSVETGSGASTLLLSHISKEHKVFSYDCGSNGLSIVRSSALINQNNIEFIEGPTQQTLPKYKFNQKIQLALIDGPHAYPFPELEYYFIYPNLAENALLILDDIHIPNIHNMFIFIAEDEMFRLIDIVGKTAFFRRTNKPVFSPIEDNWFLQNFNKLRFPITE